MRYHMVLLHALLTRFALGSLGRQATCSAFLSRLKNFRRSELLVSKMFSNSNQYLGQNRGGEAASFPLGSTNGDINNESNDDLPEARTGWNHNQPDETSSYWVKSSGVAPNGAQREQPKSTSRESNKEPRTGWLHNKEPTQQAKERNLQQEQQTSQARLRLQQAMKEQEQNHRMISPPSFHACGNSQMVVTEHVLSVPLYRNVPRSPRIDIYFSIVEKVSDKNRSWLQDLAMLSPNQRAKQYVEKLALDNADDMLVYLQGGPGFGSPIPMVSLGFSPDSSWAAAAMSHYSRVVLMDQRGTGRSTPITKQTLETQFPDLFALDDHDSTKPLEEYATSHPVDASKVEKAVEETTEYMAQFRADNIVLDAEEIKDALMMPTLKPSEGPLPWGCALGQSFGGFCIMTYLSKVDNPPKICLLTGGIAPMLTPIFDAYTALWGRVKERSLQYYEMYPGDIRVIKRIVQKLLQQPAKLPSGGLLTARRFLLLGLGFGGSPSTFASFHATISTALLVSMNDSSSEFSRSFLKAMDSAQSFDDHPIYFWLHESIYGDGPDKCPTDWAAHRAYETLAQNYKEYDYQYTSSLLEDDAQPTLFFGEMVFPWMPEDFQELSGVGMQALAKKLAAKSDWPEIYDGDHMRKVLNTGISRAAAAVYVDDMYVDFNASMKVAARGGPLEKCKIWITNEYQHSGLRDGGSSIFARLHGMATGSVRTPS